MNSIIRSTLPLSVCMFVFTACSKESVDFTADCSGTAYSFSVNVAPVIEANCAASSGCHASGSTRGPGELLTYQQVYNARNAIRSAVASGAMPREGTLTTAEKNAILCWIDSGTADN